MSGFRLGLGLCVLAGLGVVAVAWAGERGAEDARGVRSPALTATAPDHPSLPVDTAPVATLAPAPPPTPSYNYVWDPNNPYQCFDPKDPQLPANAPRCPPRVVPPDPGGPILVAPTPKH